MLYLSQNTRQKAVVNRYRRMLCSSELEDLTKNFVDCLIDISLLIDALLIHRISFIFVNFVINMKKYWIYLKSVFEKQLEHYGACTVPKHTFKK